MDIPGEKLGAPSRVTGQRNPQSDSIPSRKETRFPSRAPGLCIPGRL